jgi:hypothetical protein
MFYLFIPHTSIDKTPQKSRLNYNIMPSTLLVSASLLGCALGSVIQPRQLAGQVYCEANDGFNPEDCRAAMEMINTSDYYRDVAEFRYGDCSIDASGLFATTSITGQVYKDSIGKILEQCEDGAGYVEEGELKVEVKLCQVCERGICVTCSSPGQGPLKRSALPIEATYVLGKRQEAEPGLRCAPGAATKSDACRDAASEIEGRGGDLTLPFREGFTDCQVAIEQTKPGLTYSASEVAEKIRYGADACDNKGYIGSVDDTRDSERHLFFGRLCGKFGFGYGGCTP